MRRPNPDRIREAQRAGLRARMIGHWRLTEARADELLAGWDAEAAERGIDPDGSDHVLDREAWLRERLTSE